MKLSTKFVLVIVGIIIIAAILKPSYSRFKEFAQENDNNGYYQFNTRKVNDFILFAVFEKKIYVKETRRSYILARTETYYGCLLNFFLKSNVSNV